MANSKLCCLLGCYLKPLIKIKAVKFASSTLKGRKYYRTQIRVINYKKVLFHRQLINSRLPHKFVTDQAKCGKI